MKSTTFIFALLFGRRLPITSGKLEVSGVRKSVLIRRDEYGIPYIEAKGDEDAWYGLGFCHGQDRAFQLEGLLRVVRGTLAELSGPAALPVDRLSRRIGFFHSAEKHLQVLDHDVLQIWKLMRKESLMARSWDAAGWHMSSPCYERSQPLIMPPTL